MRLDLRVSPSVRTKRGGDRVTLRRDPTDVLQMLLSVDNAGRLVCADGHRCPAAADCSCWILSVPLADDCHAYNCRLTLLAAGTVGLHTTAAVPPGQPLKMWFPPDLQLMLHVPFLTPVNIRGKRESVSAGVAVTRLYTSDTVFFFSVFSISTLKDTLKPRNQFAQIDFKCKNVKTRKQVLNACIQIAPYFIVPAGRALLGLIKNYYLII